MTDQLTLPTRTSTRIAIPTRPRRWEASGVRFALVVLCTSVVLVAVLVDLFRRK